MRKTNLVCIHVFFDIRFLSECPATDDTLERLFPRVSSNVLLEVKVFGEGFVAILTEQFLLLSLHD
jgi:hypothetical protein